MYVLKPAVNTKEFLKTFLNFLTKKRGLLWHYFMKNFQRQSFKNMIENIKSGTYGRKVLLLVTDFAENYAIKDGNTLSSDQWYHRRKCQMLSVISYVYRDSYKCESNFILSEKKVIKSAEFAVQEILKIIKTLSKLEKFEKILIWSDGSTKEFMNASMFGNIGKFTKQLEIGIIWNFFANNHGKNPCDSQ